MADPIAALLGLDIADDEQTRALAERLRSRKQAADLFAGVQPLAGIAQSEQDTVLGSAKQAGELRRAAQQRAATQQLQEERLAADLARQQDSQRFQSQENESSRADQIEEWTRQQDAIKPTPYQAPDGTIKLGRMVGGQLVDRVGTPIPEGSVPYSNNRGAKPGTSTLQGYMKTKGLDDSITSLDDMKDNLSDTALGQLDLTTGDVLLDIGRKVLPGQSADLAARNTMYTDPQAQQMMEMFSRLESEVLQLISGKQITGIEAEKANKWSPNAPGLTLDQRIRRAKNLQERLRTNMEMFEVTYPDWKLRGAVAPASPQGGIEYMGVVTED